MYIKPFYIAVYPVGSKFAKSLQAALQERVTNRIYRVSPSRHLREGRSRFTVTLNPLNKVAQFVNFAANSISCPRFATTVQGAKDIECKTLFARQLINSTNGRGIVEFESSDERYPQAPLYTEYIPKKAEYRFHVFNGQVIDIQQKKKKKGFDETQRDSRVRNLHNGYVYCRDGVSPPNGAAN